jgi:hypothetical protein
MINGYCRKSKKERQYKARFTVDKQQGMSSQIQTNKQVMEQSSWATLLHLFVDKRQIINQKSMSICFLLVLYHFNIIFVDQSVHKNISILNIMDTFLIIF